MSAADLGSDALRTLIVPPVAPMLAVLAGWALRHRLRAAGRALIVLGAVVLYVTSTPLGAAALLRSLESDPVLDPTIPKVDALVVLGGDMYDAAPEYDRDTVGPLSLERARYAASLQRRTGLPLLVAGGRLKPDRRPVALSMAEVLTAEFLVPVRWIEPESRDTWENASRAAAMLRPQGVVRILLVTHAWHMRRAKIAFAAAGLEVVPAPTRLTAWPSSLLLALLPNARALPLSAYAIHEWIGVLWYEWRQASAVPLENSQS
jgi:uncharacterized SAM-binding protein YcdF (DUF218 family)